MLKNTKREAVMLRNTRRQTVALTRAVMIGLLGISFGAALGPEAEAHLAGTFKIGGTWVHISSFSCINDIGGVPNPDTRPSLFQCTATATKVLLLCQNPQGHDVRPGEAATKTTVVVQDRIIDSDITNKKKGLAHKEIEFVDAPFLDPEFCVNPNWIPIDVLVTELTGTMEVFECTSQGIDPCTTKVLTYTETKECMLPPEFDFDNPPVPGTPYDCVLIFRQHVK